MTGTPAGSRTPSGPASSEAAAAVVRVRPRRIRVVAFVAAPLVVVFFAVVATALSGGTGNGTAVFQPGDRLAMIGLGVAGALAILTFARPLVEADARGVRIRNMIGGYTLPWQVVRAVRFDRGAAWASLELADDELVSVMAVQRADKEHAVAAVRELRALLAAHGSADPSRGPADPSYGPADPIQGPADPSRGPADPSYGPADPTTLSGPAAPRGGPGGAGTGG